MRTLYVMVGVPASGKTTKAKEVDGTRVSFDDIREYLYGDASCRGVQSEIQAEFKRRMTQLIVEGKSVVLDYQGLTPESRGTFISQYGRYFERLVAVYLNTPLEVCLERNRQRSRHVPEFVIRRNHNMLCVPDESEGFHEVIEVRPNNVV